MPSFFFNDTATTEIYTLSLHDALPISAKRLGAQTIWTQSGLSAAGVNDPKGCWMPEEELRLARNLVESAGLRYITGPYIGDAAQRGEWERTPLKSRH